MVPQALHAQAPAPSRAQAPALHYPRDALGAVPRGHRGDERRFGKDQLQVQGGLPRQHGPHGQLHAADDARGADYDPRQYKCGRNHE